MDYTRKSTSKIRVAGIVQKSDEIMRMASRGIFAMWYPPRHSSKVIKEIAEQISKS